MAPEIARLRRATDWVLCAYLLATTALIIIWRAEVPGWAGLAGLHAVGVALLVAAGRLPDRLPQPSQLLRDWYPVLLFPLLYKEVELLAAAFGDWTLTGLVYDWESRLFGGQPAVYLADLFPSLLLSEYLHLCYFGYLTLLPVIGGLWYFGNRRTAFHELLLVVTLIYASCFLFYTLYPVDSPFYRVEPPGAPQSQGWAYQLVHFFSDRGGARGGAFPSTHVAISAAIWLVCLRRDRRLAFVLCFLVPGLWVATVYGRFHYALDVVAGWLVALAAWAIVARGPAAAAAADRRR